jgi:anti-sigma B factor antagonist
MSPTATIRPPVAHMRVSGDVDLATAPRLRSVVARAIGQGCTVLRLDLGDVSFIDCAGLRSLLASAAEAEASGAQLTLHSVPARVTRLLELTGTSHHLLRPA